MTELEAHLSAIVLTCSDCGSKYMIRVEGGALRVEQAQRGERINEVDIVGYRLGDDGKRTEIGRQTYRVGS